MRPYALAFLVLATCPIAAAQTFQLRDGDIVQIWRHKFKPAKFAEARAEFVKRLMPLVKSDGNTQHTVIAEDAKSGEILGISLSRPEGASKNRMRKHLTPLDRHRNGPTTRHDYTIFAHNDEKMTPKVGDVVMTWDRRVDSKHKAEVRSFMSKQFVAMLAKDQATRDSYLLEGKAPGEFLAIAFTPAADTRHLHRQNMRAHVKRTGKNAVARQYRVIAVRWE